MKPEAYNSDPQPRLKKRQTEEGIQRSFIGHEKTYIGKAYENYVALCHFLKQIAAYN